jgi:hypothetical protein
MHRQKSVIRQITTVELLRQIGTRDELSLDPPEQIGQMCLHGVRVVREAAAINATCKDRIPVGVVSMNLMYKRYGPRAGLLSGVNRCEY